MTVQIPPMVFDAATKGFGKNAQVSSITMA